MNTIKKSYTHVLYIAIIMIALIMTVGPAGAVTIKATGGKVVAPDTELHALGSKALTEGLGGISYFASSDGRVLKVHAEELANGDLRVTVKESLIPNGYTAKTPDQALEAERILSDIKALTGKQPRVGEYAVLPHSEGMNAYEFGVRVEKELNRTDGSNID